MGTGNQGEGSMAVGGQRFTPAGLCQKGGKDIPGAVVGVRGAQRHLL